MLIPSTGLAQQAEGAISLDIRADKRCQDKEKKHTDTTTTTNEKWVFDVAIKNGSFQGSHGTDRRIPDVHEG